MNTTCFYCGALLSKSQTEFDHFPIPESCGGKHTVPACKTCHDMKDRFTLDSWIASENGWLAKFMDDFPKMSRETKILLAKIVAVNFHSLKVGADRTAL